jgi:hypothetical protein
VAFFGAVAVEDWARQEASQAGRALDAAVDELVAAAAGMGAVLDDSTAAAIGAARWFAGRLRSGAATTADEFHQGHQAVRAALDGLRKSFDEPGDWAPVGPIPPIAEDTTPLTSNSR